MVGQWPSVGRPLLVLLKAQIEDRRVGLYERIELIRLAEDPSGPLGTLVGRLDAAISRSVALEDCTKKARPLSSGHDLCRI